METSKRERSEWDPQKSYPSGMYYRLKWCIIPGGNILNKQKKIVYIICAIKEVLWKVKYTKKNGSYAGLDGCKFPDWSVFILIYS